MITPEQCRAARALLGWSQSDLELESKVARKTLADFEGSKRFPYERTLCEIRRALEWAGVIFIPENSEGPGVRLRKLPVNGFLVLDFSDLGWTLPAYFGILFFEYQGSPSVMLSNPPHLNQTSITNNVEHVAVSVYQKISEQAEPRGILEKILKAIGFKRRPNPSEFLWFQYYPPEAHEYGNVGCQQVTFSKHWSPKWGPMPKEVIEIGNQAHAHTEWPLQVNDAKA